MSNTVNNTEENGNDATLKTPACQTAPKSEASKGARRAKKILI